MIVKLSAFTVVDGFPPGTDPSRSRLREVVDLARAAEAAGLSGLWVAEHHFHTGGVCPHPPALLAACAEATRRLRVGVMVSNLSLHNPISLAEEYAVVDQLSEGRLNFGAGSGYLPLEFEGFGIDPSTKRERFDRALEVIEQGWRGEPVGSEAPGSQSVRLNLRPAQRPGPPLWIAVQRRAAIPFVARRGASLALIPYATLGTLDELPDLIREYRDQAPAGRGEVAVALHLAIADDLRPARAALQAYLDGRLATHSTFYREKVQSDPASATAGRIEEGGFALFGSAPEVGRRLRALEAMGVDELLALMDFGGLSSTEVHRSVHALGELAAGMAHRPGPR